MSIFSIGILVAIIMIAVIWFAFVAPSERRYHAKKLELLQQRIEKRKQFLKEGKPSQDDDKDTADEDSSDRQSIDNF